MVQEQSMDRELDRAELRRRLLKKVSWVALPLILGVLSLAALAQWLRPELDLGQVQTARVERGPVEASFQASGAVMPKFEKVLSSPIEARILEILKSAGAQVEEGEALVRLDTSVAQLEFERLEDRVALKQAEIAQIRIEHQQTLEDLRNQIRRQRLDLEIFEYQLQQNEQIHAEGLISEEALRQAEVSAQKARIELEQLGANVDSTQQALAKQIERLDLEAAILRKERAQAKRVLELATIRADRDGVLTWIVQEEGTTVQRGATLARVADVGSYRVEATASDIHTQLITLGQPVEIRLNGDRLAGHVSRIYPTIEEGTVRFVAELDRSSDLRLRNKLRVDVLVITATDPDSLRLRRGPFFQGGESQEVYIVESEQAVKRRVRFGMVGQDYLEIVEGLESGDQVIISDMEEYQHLAKVKLT